MYLFSNRLGRIDVTARVVQNHCAAYSFFFVFFFSFLSVDRVWPAVVDRRSVGPAFKMMMLLATVPEGRAEKRGKNMSVNHWRRDERPDNYSRCNHPGVKDVLETCCELPANGTQKQLNRFSFRLSALERCQESFARVSSRIAPCALYNAHT